MIIGDEIVVLGRWILQSMLANKHMLDEHNLLLIGEMITVETRCRGDEMKTVVLVTIYSKLAIYSAQRGHESLGYRHYAVHKAQRVLG